MCDISTNKELTKPYPTFLLQPKFRFLLKLSSLLYRNVRLLPEAHFLVLAQCETPARQHQKAPHKGPGKEERNLCQNLTESRNKFSPHFNVLRHFQRLSLGAVKTRTGLLELQQHWSWGEPVSTYVYCVPLQRSHRGLKREELCVYQSMQMYWYLYPCDSHRLPEHLFLW